jgi:hypothetical protein
VTFVEPVQGAVPFGYSTRRVSPGARARAVGGTGNTERYTVMSRTSTEIYYVSETTHCAGRAVSW